MDTKEILSSLLSASLTNQISQETNTSSNDVKSVITAALPYLLNGNKTTEKENEEVSKQTGVDLAKVASIVTIALPIVKKLIENIDFEDIFDKIKDLTSSKKKTTKKSTAKKTTTKKATTTKKTATTKKAAAKKTAAKKTTAKKSSSKKK